MNQSTLNSLLYSFWSMIDISDNILRARTVLKRHASNESWLFFFVSIVFIAMGATILAVFFDFAPTFQQISLRMTDIVAALQSVSVGIGFEWEATVKIIGWIGLILTLFPTLVEFFGVSFAQAGISVFRFIVYGMLVFDLATNWPIVTQVIGEYSFDSLGWTAVLVRPIVYLLGLFMATFGFEAIAAVALYSAFYMLRLKWIELRRGDHLTRDPGAPRKQGGRKPPQGAPRQQVQAHYAHPYDGNALPSTQGKQGGKHERNDKLWN